jgi:hypothetical protein
MFAINYFEWGLRFDGQKNYLRGAEARESNN